MRILSFKCGILLLVAMAAIFCQCSAQGVAPRIPLPPSPPVIDDGVYVTASTTLHASWTCQSQSPIAEYQYGIGTTSGGTQVTNGWVSVGTATEVTNSSLSLTSETEYWFTVKAKNSLGVWGNPGVSDGVVYLPPPKQVLDGEYVTTLTPSLHASWSCDGSPVYGYSYCIGTTPGGSDIVGLTSSGTGMSCDSDTLSLTNGATYYFKIEAAYSSSPYNHVSTEESISDGITVDATAPSTPEVLDDGDYTTTTTSLSATWSAADAQSGIAEYQYAIGTTAGGTQTVGWTTTGTATGVTKSGLSLADGTYFFSVKAKNGAGSWSDVGSSDGIIVDTTDPTFSDVAADPEWARVGTDVVITFTSSEALAEDPTVTVDGNEATFLYKENTTDYTFMYTIQSGDANPAPIAIFGTDLAANEGTGGNATLLKTYTVSEYAPAVTDDGDETVDTTLHATWEAPESVYAEGYRYAVGTTPGGNDVVDWTSVGTDTEVTTDPLSLTLDTTYFISVQAYVASEWGDAGTSNGIRYVDFMLNVDFPSKFEMMPAGYTLPMTWDDDSKTHDVRGRIGVASGNISGATVTVNGSAAEVTGVDDRHATWSNLNSEAPVQLAGGEWSRLSVQASHDAHLQAVKLPLGTAYTLFTDLVDECNFYMDYVSEGVLATAPMYEDYPSRVIQATYQLLITPAGYDPNRIVVGIMQTATFNQGLINYTGFGPPPFQLHQKIPDPDGPIPAYDSLRRGLVFGDVEGDQEAPGFRGAPPAATLLKMNDSPFLVMPRYGGNSQLGTQWLGDDPSGYGDHTTVTPGLLWRFADYFAMAIDSQTSDSPQDQTAWKFYPLPDPTLRPWHVYFKGTFPHSPLTYPDFDGWYGQECWFDNSLPVGFFGPETQNGPFNAHTTVWDQPLPWIWPWH